MVRKKFSELDGSAWTYLILPSSSKNTISSSISGRFLTDEGNLVISKCKASSNTSTILDGNSVKSNVKLLLNCFRALT